MQNTRKLKYKKNVFNKYVTRILYTYIRLQDCVNYLKLCLRAFFAYEIHIFIYFQQ